MFEVFFIVFPQVLQYLSILARMCPRKRILSSNRMFSKFIFQLPRHTLVGGSYPPRRIFSATAHAAHPLISEGRGVIFELQEIVLEVREVILEVWEAIFRSRVQSPGSSAQSPESRVLMKDLRVHRMSCPEPG